MKKSMPPDTRKKLLEMSFWFNRCSWSLSCKEPIVQYLLSEKPAYEVEIHARCKIHALTRKYEDVRELTYDEYLIAQVMCQ